MSKSKFDCMEFFGGATRCFVVNASTHNEEQALALWRNELEIYEGAEHEIELDYIRYYPKTPEHLQGEIGTDGCWTFCSKGRGAVLVWRIEWAYKKRNQC